MTISRFVKPGFIPALITLFITLQLSACNTEDLIATVAPDIGSANTTIIDTNHTAVISGIDAGNITEDDDPDGNNLLEVSGKLNISDSDADEAAFIAKTINSDVGSLTIDTAGNWNYTANNDQSVIQDLASGTALTDNLTVSTVDSTTHTITITILGADEIGDISMSWIAPAEREDSTSLSLSQIEGYKIYYGTTSGQYTDSVVINDGSADGYTLKDLTTGTYYLVVTTLDTEGRESQHSFEVIAAI